MSRSFEGIAALSDIDLELAPGEVLGLIGPNGAGKTTLVNLLSGFDLPSHGRVELGGRDITRWPPYRRGRAGLARTFQHGRLFGELSVAENVEVAALGVGCAPREARRRAGELLELLGLADRALSPAGLLPHGDQRKLGVARALALRPRFVLMDEPAAGLHEAEIPAFAAALRFVHEEFGAGILLIDHNIGLIMDACHRVHVLDRGTTLAVGTPEEVRGNLDVATAYLGAAGNA
ncbi:MAG TPA: ATP-binding cassette domain-containing protein [Solirubrobacteraceae bacterium]|nr:ATP-binding cassette domain-containing protein [Solirubrobacteraceae bacterium]